MPLLQGTVKLPGMGEVPKKYVALGVGAVAVFVGIGYYRKTHAAPAAVVGTQDVSSIDTTPVGPGGPTDQAGNPVLPPIVQQPTTTFSSNLDWLSAAQALDLGIDPGTVTAALTNVLGGIPVTQAQADIYHRVVGIIDDPPQGLPFGPPRLTSTPTPPTTGGSGGTAAHWVYVKQTHQISQETPARTLIERFSDQGASPNQIQTALTKTVADNPRYRAYYGSHGGQYPAQAALTVTVVKKVAA